jgi:hypothetical protein
LFLKIACEIIYGVVETFVDANGHWGDDFLSFKEDRALRNMYEHKQRHEVSIKTYFQFEKESVEKQTRMTDQQEIDTP